MNANPSPANTPASWPKPPGGWPSWLWTVRHDTTRHPDTTELSAVADGANCQLYAYALLDLYGLSPRPHRSSELWGDASHSHPAAEDFAPLDLALFNDTQTAWGAHFAVRMAPGELLHLSASVGTPAVWPFERFAADPRYRHLIGMVRVSAG